MQRSLLLLLFAISGAVALIYEVVWTRALLLLLGSTAAASALVIALFVAGLGLGARWGGRRVARTEPLRLYAACEAGAALWAALALPLLALLGGPYEMLAPHGVVWAWGLRLLLAALVVLPSAFLLGATLPALVAKWCERSGTAATGTAWLYGVNALGAAVGALVPAWGAFERFGVRGTLWGAVVAGLVVAGVAWGARGPRKSPSHARRPVALGTVRWLAMGAGALGLAIEVVGFRVLVFFVEGFTITVAAMLATFVVGLAAGSLTLGPWLVRTTRPVRVLGTLIVLEGLVLLALWYGFVPNFEGWMGTVKQHFFADATTPLAVSRALRGAGLVGALSLLFLPAFVLGPTFALCVRAGEQTDTHAGDVVGGVYLWNAMGSLLGPVVATFALVPLLGVGMTWVALGLVAALWGGWLVSRKAAVLALAVCAIVPWLGVESVVAQSIVLKSNSERTLIDIATDATTTASVVQTPDGERLLYTDDFPAAAVGRHYRYMRMLGLLPCIVAAQPRRTMVIAYGTGTTAGAVAKAPGVESIEVVEVSRAVLDLAPHFTDVNQGVLADPRTRVLRDDGRNALRVHAPDLDVITLEPLMPYSPAGLPFYTREFYELARSRLRDGGVICQWIPVHAMPAELYAAFVRTFFEVFEDGSLWFFEQSTALIGHVGSKRPNREDVARRLATLREPLHDAGITDPQSFAAACLATRAQVWGAPAPHRAKGLDPNRTVRDLDPYPEFFPTPRARLSTPYLAHTMEYLATLVDPAHVPGDAPWWPEGAGVALRETTAAAMAARWQDAVAQTLSLQIRALPPGHPNLDEQRQLRREALKNAAKGYATARAALPEDPVLAWRHVRTLRRHASGEALHLIGRARSAQEAAKRREHALLAARLLAAALPPALTDIDPVATERAATLHVYVAALMTLGRCVQAHERVVRAVDEGVPGLKDLAQALHQAVAGTTDGLAPAWVFAHAGACNTDDRDRLVKDFDAMRSARRGVERQRAALLAWVKRAHDGVLQDTARAQLAAWRPEALPEQLVRAGAEDRLVASSRALLPWFEDATTAGAALLEAARAKVAHKYVDQLDAFAASANEAMREALANAAALWTAPVIQRKVVELLADPSSRVRQAAWTALLPHARDPLERYRPTMTAGERASILETLRRKWR